jgi:transposase
MAKRQGKTDYGVTAEDFIVAWQESRTAQEVADRLGMPKPIIHARASEYRRAGIKLKPMPRGRAKQLDLQQLNRLAEAALESAPKEAQPLDAKPKKDLSPKDPKEVEAIMRELLGRKDDSVEKTDRG